MSALPTTFVNRRGFEQTRLLLLTDANIYRVRFDFDKSCVLSARQMPLPQLHKVVRGHVRTTISNRLADGFALHMALDSLPTGATKAFVFHLGDPTLRAADADTAILVEKFTKSISALSPVSARIAAMFVLKNRLRSWSTWLKTLVTWPNELTMLYVVRV